jgi:DNA-binding NarL/FixJ family response regulator
MSGHTRYSEDDRGRSVSRNTIAFIDAAPLTRECFTRVVESEHPGIRMAAFESVEEWKQAERETHFDAVTCSVGPGNLISIGVALRDLVAQASPTVALADVDSIEMMTAAVNCGAWGCIPTRIGVDALIHAVRLISSGCVALPVTAFTKVRHDAAALPGSRLPDDPPEEIRVVLPEAPLAEAGQGGIHGNVHGSVPGDFHGNGTLFTPRQWMVAEALRQGKANKVIARELDICENTVKVHIRVIMRKLNVRNRTEAAFKMSLLDPNYTEMARPA